MYQSHREATFKTLAWSAMKTAVAGAHTANAVSPSVSPEIHTDTLLVSVISSAGAMKNVAVSASALPAWAWASAPTATEETEEKSHVQKAVEESAAFFVVTLSLRG